jgi:hypothetical protein
MTRPIRIQSETSPKSLKEMSNTEINYASYILLNVFASNTAGVGTLSVNPVSPGSLTLIGTFTDTYRPYNVGDHPIGTTITSETYDFYQDLTTDATAISTRPVQYTPGQGITTQSNTDIQGYITSIAASNLVASGLGSYKLQTTAPVGGTWTSIATILDKASGGNTTTYLWRKTSDSAPTTYRPLKDVINGNIHSLKEMSDTELEGLLPVFRNYIVSSGIGQYRLQQNAPVSGGTWIVAGSAFSDTREQTGNVSYTGSYSGSYTGFFSGNYTGSYSRGFTGSYSTAFAGAYAGTYVLYYAGIPYGYFTGYYTGYYTGFFSGTYTGFFSGTYTGSYSSSFTGTYSGGYTGNTLLATKDTVSTVSLWIRTA